MNVNKAYHTLAERSGHGDSELLIKIFATSMTPEEAALLVELPATSTDLAHEFNIDEKTVENMINNLTQRGLIVPSRKGARFPRELSFLRDEMLSSAPEFIPPELPQLWNDFYEAEWWREIADAMSIMGVPLLRVIPAQKAVPPDVEPMPWENVRCIIETAKIAAVRNCPCRVMVKGCDLPIHTCMQFNRRAQHLLNRGSSKQIPVNEVVAIALSAEDAGLVPIVANISILERLDYMCYCCSCCCEALNPLIRADKLTTGIAKSRFVANINQEICNGCQICMERCHFSAIDMIKIPGSKKLKPLIDPEKCYGCGLCVIKCPVGALELKLIRPPEHVPSTLEAMIP